MLSEVKSQVANVIASETGLDESVVFSSFETPREGFGDISSKVAFILAKEKKENPAAIAKSLCERINGKCGNLIEKVVATGPYVNIYFSNDFYADALKRIMKENEKYGMGKTKKGKIIIEFPSVNPNKPWHIGHLRNALLGDSVARVLEFSGQEIERMDYIDDLGLQVAQSIWGYFHLSDKIDKKTDLWLGEQYVKVAKMLEEKKDVETEVREIVKELEHGEGKIAEKGRWLVEECVKSQYATAFDFSIYHDALIFESDIIRTIFDEGLETLKKNNAIVLEKEGKNAGCWVVKLAGEFANMTDPDKILIRSDGTATYTGKDVIFQLWKFGKLSRDFYFEPFIKQPNKVVAEKTSKKGKKAKFGKAAKVINVIGVEQAYPQKVIAEVLRRLGYEKEADSSIHLAYNHASLPDVNFSGRAGTWIGYSADDLLAEAKRRVMEKIKPEFSDEEKKAISAVVGVAAIKFSFLRTSSDKKLIFEWDKALSMEGDSGPYAQYAFVRTHGIMGKVDLKPSVSSKYLFSAEEKKLIRKLCEFPELVQKSAKDLAMHYIPEYTLDVASDFNKFYATSSVMNAETEDAKKSRLAIVLATNILLKNSLGLVGIECPNKM